MAQPSSQTGTQSSNALDAALVARSLRGDQEAFATLFDRHAPRVYGLAYHALGNRAEAEDVTQEAFAQALAALETLRQPAAFGGWLLRIASNLTTNALRRRGRLPLAELSDAILDTYADQSRATSPEAVGLSHEDRSEVLLALNRLAPSQRTALALREIGGLSYREIASELRTTQGSVEALLFRARARFRDEYRKVALGATSLLPRRCRETQHAVAALADHELPVAEEARLTAHARRCNDCSAAVRTARELHDLFTNLPAMVPLSVKYAVLSKAGALLAAQRRGIARALVDHTDTTSTVLTSAAHAVVAGSKTVTATTAATNSVALGGASAAGPTSVVAGDITGSLASGSTVAIHVTIGVASSGPGIDGAGTIAAAGAAGVAGIAAATVAASAPAATVPALAAATGGLTGKLAALALAALVAGGVLVSRAYPAHHRAAPPRPTAAPTATASGTPTPPFRVVVALTPTPQPLMPTHVMPRLHTAFPPSSYQPRQRTTRHLRPVSRHHRAAKRRRRPAHRRHSRRSVPARRTHRAVNHRPTATATPTPTSPTATPTDTVVPTSTFTVAPTATFSATATATPTPRLAHHRASARHRQGPATRQRRTHVALSTKRKAQRRVKTRRPPARVRSTLLPRPSPTVRGAAPAVSPHVTIRRTPTATAAQPPTALAAPIAPASQVIRRPRPPTAAPTTTVTPTRKPTATPTLAPTSTPTRRPTRTPSPTRSARPTATQPQTAAGTATPARIVTAPPTPPGLVRRVVASVVPTALATTAAGVVPTVLAAPDVVPTVVSGVATAIPTAVAPIRTTVSGVATAVPTVVAGLATAVPTVVSGLATAVPSTVSGMATAIPTTVSGLATAVPTTVSGLATAVPSVVQGLATAVPTSVSGLLGGVPTVVTGLLPTSTALPLLQKSP